jgi:hypothetical protein
MERSLVLNGLKAFHTLVVAGAIASASYLIFLGVFGLAPEGGRFWLLCALVFPLIVGLVRLAGGRECFLQTWAKRFQGIESGWAPDVFCAHEAICMRMVRFVAIAYVAGLVLLGMQALGWL